MRIIAMGTGPFAVPALQELHATGQHEIPLVVTRPAVASRGKKQPPRPVFDWAEAQGLAIYEPQSINADEAMEHLQQQAADLFFVCDYGQILTSPCLATARLGGINLHGSLLPRHRGAAPVQWTLLRGDAQAGITVIHMTPKLDAGPALEIVSTPVQADESAAELEPRLAQLGVTATLRAIDALEHWDGQSTLGTVQDRELVTKAPRFSKAHGELDFRLPADYLQRLVKACQPWPGTFAELQWPSGKRLRVIVRRARSWPAGGLFAADAPTGSVRPVSASELGQDWPSPWQHLLAAKTSQGALLIGSLQPAGKREMTADEFLRGHTPDAKTRFGLPEPPLKPLA